MRRSNGIKVARGDLSEQLLAFLHERLSKIPGLQRIESQQVMKMLKYMYNWSAPARA